MSPTGMGAAGQGLLLGVPRDGAQQRADVGDSPTHSVRSFQAQYGQQLHDAAFGGHMGALAQALGDDAGQQEEEEQQEQEEQHALVTEEAQQQAQPEQPEGHVEAEQQAQQGQWLDGMMQFIMDSFGADKEAAPVLQTITTGLQEGAEQPAPHAQGHVYQQAPALANLSLADYGLKHTDLWRQPSPAELGSLVNAQAIGAAHVVEHGVRMLQAALMLGNQFPPQFMLTAGHHLAVPDWRKKHAEDGQLAQLSNVGKALAPKSPTSRIAAPFKALCLRWGKVDMCTQDSPFSNQPCGACSVVYQTWDQVGTDNVAVHFFGRCMHARDPRVGRTCPRFRDAINATLMQVHVGKADAPSVMRNALYAYLQEKNPGLLAFGSGRLLPKPTTFKAVSPQVS